MDKIPVVLHITRNEANRRVTYVRTEPNEPEDELSFLGTTSETPMLGALLPIEDPQ